MVDVPTVSGEDGEPVLSRSEEDALVRESTAAFPAFVAGFYRAMLNVFDNLPEPGKQGRVGGKIEEQMLSSLNAACETVTSSLSPALFDQALAQFVQHVAHSPRANSAKAVGHMAASFARADAVKTLGKLFDLCESQIRLEIESGAGSSPTTSSATPMEGDMTLQWYCLLLAGAIAQAGEAILPYADRIVGLVRYMMNTVKSERAYTHTGRLLAWLLASPLSFWTRESRFVNADEYAAEDFKQRHHQLWGKLYEVGEVKVEWHVPTEPEIAFGFRILDEIVEPALERLEALVRADGETTDRKTWAALVCSMCTIVRQSMPSLSGLVSPSLPAEPGLPAFDAGDEEPELLADLPTCKGGFVLTDPADPRYQRIVAFRVRVGRTLHESIERLQHHSADDSIDCVKMLIGTIRCLLLDYPLDRTVYSSSKKTYDFIRLVCRYVANQKKYPRVVWVRRAALYHVSRLRINSFYRKRSALDDLLIRDLGALSLSLYVSIRKSGQRALDSLTQYYDGTRTILLENLFEALQPGTKPDVMKGALYVLGSKLFANAMILDWRQAPRFMLALLRCQHQEKPSIQNLVKSISHDFIIRVVEPSTVRATVSSDSLVRAVDQLDAFALVETGSDLVARVTAKAQGRVRQKDEAYATLVPQLLAIAQSPSTHWRYSIVALRFIRVLIRRDQPLSLDLVRYMADQLVSDLPAARSHATLAMTKLLFFIKLRTLCPSPVKLLLSESVNPLKRKLNLDDESGEDYTRQFLDAVGQPMTADSRLVDKHETGYLVWARELEYYAPPPETGSVFEWEDGSTEALGHLRTVFGDATFWKTFIRHLAQEHTRDYMAADNTALVKSIFQILGADPLDVVLPLVDELLLKDLRDQMDRHHQRAAAEIIGGLFRGSKHWPLVDQRRLWDWMTPKFDRILDAISPDTQVAWEMLIEYILSGRDPRRNMPLVSFATSLHLDLRSSAAFAQAKRAFVVSTTIKSLEWQFEPWAPTYEAEYWDALTSPFAEVRSAVSENLRQLAEIRLHPSFRSVDALLERGRQSDTGLALLVDVDATFRRRVSDLRTSLERWRAERQPASSGSQPYDQAALTVLAWVWAAAQDHRLAVVLPFVETLVPELFCMQEMLDNDELRETARSVLAMVASLPYPASHVRPVMTTLLGLLRTSASWRVRLDVLPVLQVFFFQQLALIGQDQTLDFLNLLCDLLSDPNVEVREAAATTLSGVVRCSQRHSILGLRDRFLRVIRSVRIPRRRDERGVENPAYASAVLQAHAGVLGASALILAWPYDIVAWMPAFLLETMGRHVGSPAPVATTVKATLASFKASHQDSWTESQRAFTADQLLELQDLLVPRDSYFA